MKYFFWTFGGLEFIWSLLPFTLTGGWLGAGDNTAYIAGGMAKLTGLVCIGIGCILHKMDTKKQ